MEENNHIPSWLKNLQENSWELELLISGGAIFSLFQISDLFLDFIFTVKMTSHIPGTGLFAMCGMLGIKLLTVGFVTHLLLRAYWLGLVCINYVFPKGIADKKSVLKEPFKDKYTANESLQKNITKVDRASGLVMFISILSIVIIVGFLVMVFTLLTLPSLFFNIPDAYFSTVAWLLIVYYMDLLTFGVLRKIPFLSYLTYPILKVLDTISLRWAYHKSLKLFSSNVVKWKAVIGFSFLFFFGIFFAYTAIYRSMHWPNIIDSRAYRMQMAPADKWQSFTMYYDKINEEGLKVNKPVIQTDIIKGNYLKIFVPYNINMEDELINEQYLSDAITVKIDDSLIQSVEWHNYWAKDIDQIGMQAVINISQLSYTKHMVEISHKNDPYFGRLIPFWKDVND